MLLFMATIVTQTYHNVILYYITCIVFPPSFPPKPLYISVLCEERNMPYSNYPGLHIMKQSSPAVTFSLCKSRTMLPNTLSLSSTWMWHTNFHDHAKQSATFWFRAFQYLM